MKKIGVEKGLKNVADYLTKEGYSVELIGESMESASRLSRLDALVVAGYNTNMMGIHDTETKAPVIDATGLTPQEVKSMIDNGMKR